MKILKFEDLECWQEARKLAKMVYNLVNKDRFSKDYRLSNQIVGSAISVLNNIAEGFDSQSNNEFIRFLRISRREGSEIQSCLYAAIDQEYITNEEFQKTYEQAVTVKKLVDGFIRYLKACKAKPTKPAKQT